VPQFSVYADLESLLQSPLAASLGPTLLEAMGEALNGNERACVSALSAHAKELLGGGSEKAAMFALSLGAQGVQAARAACSSSLGQLERVTLPNVEEAYGMGNGVIVILPDVVLIGATRLVEAALAPGVAAGVPLPEIALRAGEQASFRFHLPQPAASGSAALSASPQRFSIAGGFELATEAAADNLDKKLSMARSQAKLLTQAMTGDATLARLVDSIEVERRARTFQVRFELRGTPAEQARDLSTITALGVHGVRKYLVNAKAAEAKATLARITKSYQASLMDADSAKPKRAKKLLSLPPVPAAVPRGAKYQSSADDWKPWAAIQFQRAEPQYFQYEVVAAKDGKTAEVLARGDLDGDGVTSLYRLKIELDAKTGQLRAQGLDETEPLE
jgi:hypothetical protein